MPDMTLDDIEKLLLMQMSIAGEENQHTIDQKVIRENLLFMARLDTEIARIRLYKAEKEAPHA